MKCLRCGNSDPAYFYKGSKGYYCRKCIRFSRILLEEEAESFDYEVASGADEYQFGFELTKHQKQASEKCVEALKKNDVLLECVCGAGKTEITVASISEYLAQGKKVAYAIARKEVVIELGRRFSRIFPKARVVSVYGGHHEVLSGDLIVCTCHQLYRYFHTFDLLILDEVDAFPLKGNETLMNIALSSCKGRIIFSTATVDSQLMKVLKKRSYQKVSLSIRPSGRPLSVPKVIYLNRYLACICLYRIMSLSAKQGIIFVYSKKHCRILYRVFSRFCSCTYVYSDLPQRQKNIEAFRNGEYQFIFATSVLERGITIANIDVCILHFDKMFDLSSMIQMLGRVGRGLNSEGSSYIISDRFDKTISETMKYLREANAQL